MEKDDAAAGGGFTRARSGGGVTAGATELEAQTETPGGEYIVTNTATVTIDGDSALSGSGVTIDKVSFTTYQVLYATYDKDSNAFEWHLTDWAYDALVDATYSNNTTTFATEEEAIAAISGITTSITDSTDGQSTTEQNAIINYLASYVKTANPTVSAYNATWNKSGVKATADLPVGGYLVLAGNDQMSFLNMFVSVDVYDTTGTASNEWIVSANNVVLKGKVISIEKGVSDSSTSSTYGDTTDAQVGDTVYYEITVPVPQFAIDCETYLFQIVDTPSNVAIDFDSVAVKAGTWAAQNTVDPNTATLLYEAEYNSASGTWSYVDSSKSSDPVGAGYTAELSSQDGSLTIDFSDLYLATFYDSTSQTYPYDYIYITYSAEVLSTAVTTLQTGNKNTAELTYGSSYTAVVSSYNEGEDNSKVNTYQLKLTKTAANNNNTATTLSNAEFEVFYYETTVDVSGTAVTEHKLTFIKNSDGNYEVADSTDPTTTTIYKTVTTDANGTLTLLGLDSDKIYYIQEVVAPSGYSLNENVAAFKITVDNGNVSLSSSDSVEYTDFVRGDQSGTNAVPGGSGKTVVSTSNSWTIDTDTVNVGTNNETVTEVSLTVTDTKIASLPATGSIGIIVFTIAGVAIMILALILINGGKSKEKAKQGMNR